MTQYFPATSTIIDEKQEATISVQNQGKGQTKIRVKKGSMLPKNHPDYIPGYIAVKLEPSDYAKLLSK